MSTIENVFGISPFKPLHHHAEKAHECVALIPDAMSAMFRKEYGAVRNIQDKISKAEHEADVIEQNIQNTLSERFFFALPKELICEYLDAQDSIADAAEDVAVTLILRKTAFDRTTQTLFTNYSNHIVTMSEKFLTASEKMDNLAATVFKGASAENVIEQIKDISELEWTADRMQREMAITIYEHEDKYSPITIMFYEKILKTLDEVANATDRTADLLRRILLTNI